MRARDARPNFRTQPNRADAERDRHALLLAAVDQAVGPCLAAVPGRGADLFLPAGHEAAVLPCVGPGRRGVQGRSHPLRQAASVDEPRVRVLRGVRKALGHS